VLFSPLRVPAYFPSLTVFYPNKSQPPPRFLADFVFHIIPYAKVALAFSVVSFFRNPEGSKDRFVLSVDFTPPFVLQIHITLLCLTSSDGATPFLVPLFHFAWHCFFLLLSLSPLVNGQTFSPAFLSPFRCIHSPFFSASFNAFPSLVCGKCDCYTPQLAHVATPLVVPSLIWKDS